MTIDPTQNGTRGSIQLDTSSTTVRQSPRTDFGTQMRNGIAAGAGTVGGAVGVAAPFVPGAAVVSAAVTGAGQAIQGGGSSLGGGAGTAGTVTAGVDGIPMNGPGLSTPVSGSGGQGGAGGNTQQDLLNQTKGMQEMMASFNLQYLQLQEKMQAENRSFSTVSNVMKTKHDTAKSSIGNVR
jgi:hypothetical protein